MGHTKNRFHNELPLGSDLRVRFPTHYRTLTLSLNSMAEAKSHAVFRPGLLSADKQNQFSELQVSIAKLKVRGDAAACSFTVSPCCEESTPKCSMPVHGLPAL